MKKFMKGCGIVALVFLALGLALVIAAGTVRGRETITYVVDKVTGGRVQISFDGLIGWGIQVRDKLPEPGYDIEDATSFDSSHTIWGGDMEKTCLGEDVEALKVEVGGCLFHTEVSADDSFYIKASDTGKSQAYIENGTLYVRSTTKSVTLLGSWKGSKITLYVPAGYHFKEADIELGAGELMFDALEADQISLGVGAGRITADRLKTQSLTMEIGMGQIDMKDVEVESLVAEVGMGNLMVEGTVNGDADVSCAMGNVDLKLMGSQQNFNYQIEGALGNIDLGQESYSGIGLSREIDNGAPKEMKVKCEAGNITIKFTE